MVSGSRVCVCCAGFRKRKLERKQKAKEKMERKVKEAKKQFRKEQKEKMEQMTANDQILPEVEHLVEKVDVHEVGDAIVTITSLTLPS